jgi:hypothetical protein
MSAAWSGKDQCQRIHCGKSGGRKLGDKSKIKRDKRTHSALQMLNRTCTNQRVTISKNLKTGSKTIVDMIRRLASRRGAMLKKRIKWTVKGTRECIDNTMNGLKSSVDPVKKHHRSIKPTLINDYNFV